MTEQIRTGGFPAVCIPEDIEGCGGFFAFFILFGKVDELLKLQVVLDQLHARTKIEDLIIPLQERLPELLPLMHFHIEELRKSSKVLVVADARPKKNHSPLGWFELNENREIFYCYINPFDENKIKSEPTNYIIEKEFLVY